MFRKNTLFTSASFIRTRTSHCPSVVARQADQRGSVPEILMSSELGAWFKEAPIICWKGTSTILQQLETAVSRISIPYIV